MSLPQPQTHSIRGASQIGAPGLPLEVHSLAVGADDEDHLDRPVGGTEPVRRPRAELGRLSGLEQMLVVAQYQPQLAGEDVDPVAACMDAELLRRLARDGIVVECCVTSNYHTGAVRAGARHPLHAFLEAGVKIAICCDNTTVSRTDQTRETLKVAEEIGFDAVEAIHCEAARHTFIRPETALPSGAGD